MRDVDAVMRECTSLIEEHELSAEEVREVIEADMFAEPMLAVDHTQHAAVSAASAN